MMYQVIEYFEDLQDNRHAYHVGDMFPHDGRVVNENRIAELAGSKNRRGKPLIKKISTPRKKAAKKEE